MKGLSRRQCLSVLMGVGVSPWAWAEDGLSQRLAFSVLTQTVLASGGAAWSVPERCAAFAEALLGKPYVAGSLDGFEEEQCRISFAGFDCLTLIETVLALAHSLDQPTFSHFQDCLTRLRYRGGVLDGYASRLHYLSEWLIDNQRKGLLNAPALPCQPVYFSLGYLSKHHTGRFKTELLAQEQRLRQQASCVQSLQDLRPDTLPNGSLIALPSHKAGLDYAHLGWWVNGQFLHASKAKGRVVSQALWPYLRAQPISGVTVVVPV
jgi:hypothetical protein